MPRFRAARVVRALDHAAEASKEVCFKVNGTDEVSCDVGRKTTLQVLERFAKVETIEELRKGMKDAEAEGRTICDQYDGSARRACAAGRIAVIGLFRNHLAEHAKVELTGIRPPQLGIFISPGDKCPKGFEKVKGIKGGRNKKVEICRLADGYRKYKPEERPKGKPLRRLWRKYGPGLETQKILPHHEHNIRRSSRVLSDD